LASAIAFFYGGIAFILLRVHRLLMQFHHT